MDCSLPGSSVHGTCQARILEWLAISSSRDLPNPGDWIQVSCIAGRFFVCILNVLNMYSIHLVYISLQMYSLWPFGHMETFFFPRAKNITRTFCSLSGVCTSVPSLWTCWWLIPCEGSHLKMTNNFNLLFIVYQMSEISSGLCRSCRAGIICILPMRGLRFRLVKQLVQGYQDCQWLPGTET